MGGVAGERSTVEGPEHTTKGLEGFGLNPVCEEEPVQDFTKETGMMRSAV